VTGRRPTLAARAQSVPAETFKALGRGQHDERTPSEYERDLWQETDRSLRRDPSRWRWTRAGGGRQVRERQP
jgi:hypothetical protein